MQALNTHTTPAQLQKQNHTLDDQEEEGEEEGEGEGDDDQPLSSEKQSQGVKGEEDDKGVKEIGKCGWGEGGGRTCRCVCVCNGVEDGCKSLQWLVYHAHRAYIPTQLITHHKHTHHTQRTDHGDGIIELANHPAATPSTTNNNSSGGGGPTEGATQEGAGEGAAEGAGGGPSPNTRAREALLVPFVLLPVGMPECEVCTEKNKLEEYSRKVCGATHVLYVYVFCLYLDIVCVYVCLRIFRAYLVCVCIVCVFRYLYCVCIGVYSMCHCHPVPLHRAPRRNVHSSLKKCRHSPIAALPRSTQGRNIVWLTVHG